MEIVTDKIPDFVKAVGALAVAIVEISDIVAIRCPKVWVVRYIEIIRGQGLWQY